MRPDESPTAPADGPIATDASLDTVSSDADDDVPTRIGDDVDMANAPRDAALPNYAVGRTIGLGGMGEVVLARDMRIGRDVAIKRLRSATPSPAALARFLREARIQARLDHPSIVPVHELGTDAAGQPYFTMRRLAGVTLARLLKGKEAPRSPQELLRTLVDVCQAVAFAHDRGIVHRDLKPANIMLGEFGEVHVIDWGVARVISEEPDAPDGGDVDTLNDGMTEAGTILGTPGYMAPEQAANASVGPEADVYALGATLFEVLAGEPLHPRGMTGVLDPGSSDPSPRRRAPDRAIAPELDELCVRSCSIAPAKRPTALQFAACVQGYLDGDRDVARRRALAGGELAAAHRALQTGEAMRGDAIRMAGRALALDPESRDAAALITRLMLEPPRELPPTLRARLATVEVAQQQRQGRVGMRSQIAVLVFLVAAALAGLRSAPVVILIGAWSLLMMGVAYALSRRTQMDRFIWLLVAGNAVLSALLSRLFGPLIITPVVSAIVVVSLTSYPQLIPYRRVVSMSLVTAWLVPVLLEQLGWLAPTWDVAHGAIMATSHVVRIEETATTILLIGGNVLAIAVIGALANALARSRQEAMRAVEIQAWQLRQLLPAT